MKDVGPMVYSGLWWYSDTDVDPRGKHTPITLSRWKESVEVSYLLRVQTPSLSRPNFRTEMVNKLDTDTRSESEV